MEGLGQSIWNAMRKDEETIKKLRLALQSSRNASIADRAYIQNLEDRTVDLEDLVAHLAFNVQSHLLSEDDNELIAIVLASINQRKKESK